MFLYLICKKCPIGCTELSVQNCFCEFNCKCKYDIYKQIINKFAKY